MDLSIDQFNSLSQYGKFHFKYLGYDFQSVSTGAIYSKGPFFDKFRSLALKASKYSQETKPKAPDNFTLAERR
jgi:hypothetical protein